MSRAVGGASAVGCGVFGLGGLLISVGIVVWLGSIAFDGSTDSIRSRDGDATTTQVPIAEDGAAIAIDPATGLTDGAEVRITGTDFPAGSVSITACLTNAPAGAGDRCDAGTTTVAAVGADGQVAATRTAPRVITVNGTAYDCAAAPAACSLRAAAAGRPGDPGVDAGLVFATGLPPVDAEAPPAG